MKRAGYSFIVIVFLSACSLLLDDSLLATRPSIIIASVTPDNSIEVTPIAGQSTMGYFDALASTMGICFESAWDASRQVFVIRSAEEHIRFYELADNSGLCRGAVQREPFDFTTGDILVGTWQGGYGCTAEYEILSFERDDTAQSISIRAVFNTIGDCPYELVRGLWLGIENAQDYAIQLEIID